MMLSLILLKVKKIRKCNKMNKLNQLFYNSKLFIIWKLLENLIPINKNYSLKLILCLYLCLLESFNLTEIS